MGVGLWLRREQPQSDQQFGQDTHPWPQRQAARQEGRLKREESPMKFTRVIAAAALCAATVAPLAAHHSAAMFDDGKVVEVNGTIKEVQWTNPHIWIQVIVDSNDQKTEWSIEGGSSNSLSRNGWRP